MKLIVACMVMLELGCGDSKCKRALAHLAAGPRATAACHDDKWTEGQIACITNAPSWLEVDYCSLTEEQRTHLAQARTEGDPKAGAKATIVRYVAAYRAWHADHSDTVCPPILQNLQPYTPVDMKDPWGHDYTMLCGRDLPRGVATGIAVFSAGPDGADHTADDINSWD